MRSNRARGCSRRDRARSGPGRGPEKSWGEFGLDAESGFRRAGSGPVRREDGPNRNGTSYRTNLTAL